MGLFCPLWISYSDSSAKHFLWLYNKSFLDQTCSVEISGYWLHHFFGLNVDIKRKNRTWPISSHLHRAILTEAQRPYTLISPCVQLKSGENIFLLPESHLSLMGIKHDFSNYIGGFVLLFLSSFIILLTTNYKKRLQWVERREIELSCNSAHIHKHKDVN